MKRDILYVDDEAENLIVFEASFAEYFNVVTGDSAPQAPRLPMRQAFPGVGPRPPAHARPLWRGREADNSGHPGEAGR